MSNNFLDIAEDVKVEEEQDVLSAGGAWETDVYSITCEYAYIDTTDSGAKMVYASFKDNETGATQRFSECVASNKSGTLKNTYKDKQGKNVLLPGYTRVLSLAQAMGLSVTSLSQLTLDEKTLQLWDKDEGKVTPQVKDVFLDFQGETLFAAVYKQITTVMEKDSKGQYTIPTAKTREENEFVKFFDANGNTVKELKEGVPAKFIHDWAEMHRGKVKDKTHAKAPKADSQGSAGAPAKKPKLLLNK